MFGFEDEDEDEGIDSLEKDELERYYASEFGISGLLDEEDEEKPSEIFEEVYGTEEIGVLDEEEDRDSVIQRSLCFRPDGIFGSKNIPGDESLEEVLGLEQFSELANMAENH